MEGAELDDEPQDVRDASPVQDEIGRGLIDEDLENAEIWEGIDEDKSDQKSALPDYESGEREIDYAIVDAIGRKDARISRIDDGREYGDSFSDLMDYLLQDDISDLIQQAPKKCAPEPIETMKILIPQDPCSLTKHPIIPRDRLTKQQYIDLLSTPRKICTMDFVEARRKVLPASPHVIQLAIPAKRHLLGTLEESQDILSRDMLNRLIKMIEMQADLSPEKKWPSEMFMSEKSLKGTPDRKLLNELAQPSKRHILATLEDSGGVLPSEMIDNLITTIEMETCLSPEQIGEIVKSRKRRPRKKKSSATASKKPEAEPTKASEGFDEDAVTYQHLLAQNFVKTLLNWKSNFPCEDYQDLARVVYKRICKQINYVPTVHEDRKSDQIRFLADIVAGWIFGIMVDLAEEQRDEIRDKIQKGGVPESASAESRSVEVEIKEDEKKEDDGAAQKEKDLSKKEQEEAEKRRKAEEAERKKKEKEEKKLAAQKEKEEKKRKKEEEKERKRLEKEEKLRKKKEKEDAQRKKKESEKKKKPKDTKGTEEPEEEEEEGDEGSTELEEVPEVSSPKRSKEGPPSGDTLFEVVKVMDSILQGMVANITCDVLASRIQETLYCEIVSVLNRSESKNLLMNTKAIGDICAKIATWLKQILDLCNVNMSDDCNERQLQSNLDSEEWLAHTLDVIEEWSTWLKCKIGHYNAMVASSVSEREREEWIKNFCENSARYKTMHQEILLEAKRLGFNDLFVNT